MSNENKNRMVKNNKITLGLLVFAITSTGNANGGSGTPPPSCASPCTSTPVVVCSSCPTTNNSTQNPIEVMGVTAVAAIDASRHSMEQSIDAARHSMEESKDFYETFTTIVAVLAALGTIFGFKSLKELKKELREEIQNAIKFETKDLDKLKTEYGGKITNIDNEIKVLVDDSHANIAATSTACSANTALNMYLILQKIDSIKDNEVQEFLIEASLHCSRALEYKPKDTRVLSWIYGMQGVIFYEQKEFEKSSEAFKKALEIDPDNANTLYNVACSLSLANKKDEALDYLLKAIEKKPSLKNWAATDETLKNIWDEPRFPK